MHGLSLKWLFDVHVDELVIINYIIIIINYIIIIINYIIIIINYIIIIIVVIKLYLLFFYFDT